MAPEWKSIKVPEEIYEEIESLKIHPRQPAGEVIEKGLGLLKAFKGMKPMVLESLGKDRTLTTEEKDRLRELFEKI